MTAQPDEQHPPVRIVKNDELDGQDVDVIEGEIIDGDLDEPRTVLDVVDDLVHSPYAEMAAQQAGYVVVGAVVAVRRVRDSRTPAPLVRNMKAAQVIGDKEAALDWAEQIAEFKRDRHQRRVDAIEMSVRVIPKAAKFIAIAVTVLGVLLAVGEKDARKVTAPWLAISHATAAVVNFAVVAWAPTVLAAPLIALPILWLVGRRNVDTTDIGWVRALNPAGGDDAITPSRVVVAMRDLGISALRKAIEAMPDGGAMMLSPIKIAGYGDEVDVHLPSGVSTEEIQNRRRKLAENLGRHEHELHITIPPQARTVRLWVANSGALDEPIGPSPLVTDPDMRADMYSGRAPWGENLRGDTVLVRLQERHLLITGLSNQGKTAAMRALALWLALDPFVEFRIADLKGVGDWRVFDGIASVLIQGPTDDHVIAATEMVEEAVEEMERRLVALEESGSEDGLTRDMARSGKGFHPLVIIVDEAQKAFMCPARGVDGRPYGGTKHTSRYFMAVRNLNNQGRAVNVLLWQGTQDPTDQNLPKLVREGAHLRASLVVGTESQAKMALGETPVDAGAAPHKLRQGLDKGTLVATGDALDIPAGEPSMTIRTHYVDGRQAAEIADRAKRRRARVATRAGRIEEQEPRNMLADIDEVLGDRTEKIRLAHLATMLAELAPGYDPYESLTGKALQEHLAECGIRTTNTGNVPELAPRDFHVAYTPLTAAAE